MRMLMMVCATCALLTTPAQACELQPNQRLTIVVEGASNWSLRIGNKGRAGHAVTRNGRPGGSIRAAGRGFVYTNESGGTTTLTRGGKVRSRNPHWRGKSVTWVCN